MNERKNDHLFSDLTVLRSKSIVTAFPAIGLIRILHLVPGIALAADVDVFEQPLFRQIESFCH